jgi:hypothetical protein
MQSLPAAEPNCLRVAAAWLWSSGSYAGRQAHIFSNVHDTEDAWDGDCFFLHGTVHMCTHAWAMKWQVTYATYPLVQRSGVKCEVLITTLAVVHFQCQKQLPIIER